MGAAAPKLKMTPVEYLAFERASEQRHEYADGEIFAMAGGTREHSLASQNIAGELRSAVLERPCEVHGPDMRIKTRAGKYHYADALVIWGSPVFEDETRDVVLTGPSSPSMTTSWSPRQPYSSSTTTVCPTTTGSIAPSVPASGWCSSRSAARSPSIAST